ncbi:MAG: AmpG family muropeptide MFS transporter [Ignavibacteria bacterium]|nr:AmpG family muropeptide MFS transporter [Ignavibacteria bacterium]
MSLSDSKVRHPALWVPTLYTAEGIPFVVVNVVSVLMYKSLGFTDTQIAFFTGLVTIPWALKPLWGPLLEMFKTKKHFVLATQCGGGVSFGLLALSLQLPSFFTWTLIFFGIIAINSAIHDTAADGVYITVLTEKMQAQYVGWQGAFYNVGKVLSQGAFVYVAGRLETTVGIVPAWMIVMGSFGILLLMMSVYHWSFLPTGGKSGEVKTIRESITTFWDVVISFFRKKYILWGIAFLILYRFAEGQAIKIVPLFMRAARDHGGLGLSTEEIGVLYGFFPPFAFILGSVLSGYFTARHGLRKALLPLCAFFNIPFGVYLLLALLQPTDFFAVAGLVVFEYFGYGFGFVGLTLFMMQQIAPGKYKMAHYAFATSLMQVGFIIPSMISGWVSDTLGYRDFFIWVMIATIPSFLVAWLVPFRDTRSDETVGQSQ